LVQVLCCRLGMRCGHWFHCLNTVRSPCASKKTAKAWLAAFDVIQARPQGRSGLVSIGRLRLSSWLRGLSVRVTKPGITYLAKPASGSLHYMDSMKINTTVQSLLDACVAADDPIACLSFELDRLRATGEWSEFEIHRLQNMALSARKDTARRSAAQ